MEIIKCGTKAKVGEINGTIGAIEIVYTNVLYKFEYFDKDLNYKFVWVHESELVFDIIEKQKIGFKNNN